jgi:hypothetical protein
VSLGVPLTTVTDTRDAVVGSYDDLPESEVATVLAVPLLWHQQATTTEAPPAVRGRPSAMSATVLPPARHRSGGLSRAQGSGRHRAGGSDALLVPTQTQPDSVVHTLRVGLLSAALVLSLCAAVLLVIARWLP